MIEHTELGTFIELLESQENLSKVIEMAIQVDEGTHSEKDDPALKFKSYAHAIKELLEMDSEQDEYETSIFLEMKTDEYSEDQSRYVDVHLINDNYSETILLRPEVNFDDYNNYKTFGIDFVPWGQLLKKNVRVTSEVAERTPDGYTLKEFVLGNILWELTFYGFSSDTIDEKRQEIEDMTSDTASFVEWEGLSEDADE